MGACLYIYKMEVNCMNEIFLFSNKYWIAITLLSVIMGIFTYVFNKINKILNKESRIRIVLNILSVIFLILAVISAIMSNCFIAVPNVRLMSIDNAIQTLREQGFDVQPYQDAYFENHNRDIVLFQSIEGGNFARKGATIYISYKQIEKYEESKDSMSSDANEINDDTLSFVNSPPTSSANPPEIEPMPVIYNHSANIVNGGFCCYDDGQFYFGDVKLKKSNFLSISNPTTIYNGSTYYLNSVEDYLYFTTPNENNSICRVKKDGTDFEVLYNMPCHELTYYKGWLYFCCKTENEKYQICRMNLDDFKVTVLYNCLEWYMSIYDEKIFFCNYYDNNNIYSMNLDGSGCKPIYYGECYDLCIVHDKIYFSQGVQSRELYCIDLDGGDLTLLRDSYTIYTNYRDDKLYFVDSKGFLCKCNLDGTQSEIVQNLSSYSYVTLLPNNIICSYDRKLEKNIIIFET